jgi:hypothetical protein
MICGVVALVACGLPPLKAGTTLVLSADGITVYDAVNTISWLADANLAASNRFGLPLCTTTSSTVPCVNPSGVNPSGVNPSGLMNWVGAAAWVAAMNAVNYLGHSDWQLPTTPLVDKGCGAVGPQKDSFGANCSLNALGFLLLAPQSAATHEHVRGSLAFRSAHERAPRHHAIHGQRDRHVGARGWLRKYGLVSRTDPA